MEWFFYLTEEGTLPKVKYDFEVQNQTFRRAPAQVHQSFCFKNSGGPKYNSFFLNRREASFYKKEQRPTFFGKLEFYKLFILTSKKARFWFLKKKSPQKCFLSWRDFDSALKTIVTQMSFWLVFLKMHQKQLLAFKTPFWSFLWLLTFFCAFQQYWPKQLLCVYCF